MRKLGSRYTTVFGAPVEMGAGSGFEAVFRKLCDLWVLRALLEVGGLRQWLLHGYRNTQLCAMAVGGDIELTDEPVDDKESRGILREGLQRRLTALESEMEGLSLRDFEGPRALAEKLSLVDEELSVAVFVSAVGGGDDFADWLDVFGELGNQALLHLLAKILRLPFAGIRRTLSPSGALSSCGLVSVRQESLLLCGKLDAVERLDEALIEGSEAVGRFLRKFFSLAPAPSLQKQDFTHVETEWRLLERLLVRAVSDGLEGINILLYGEAGTGKTELVRALAASLGLHLYEVTTEDEDGDPSDGNDRLRGFRVAQRVLARGAGTIVLFDEAEDVLSGASGALFGRLRREPLPKGWFTRALEGNHVPTIWISNRVTGLDTAYLRRFTYICELGSPPAAVRRAMLDRAFEHLPVGDTWLAKAAACDRLSPAHIARAARVLDLVGAPPEREDDIAADLDRIVGNSLAAAGETWARGPGARSPMRYALELLNTDVDVRAMVQGLHTGHLEARICLYGPAGTGKTALVRHLADTLGRPLLARKMSDLLGPFVGETEALIAGMFFEATEQGALLLLDEADGLLRDRRGASHRWEVTQVNELLVQMEAFQGLFLCATNLFEDLDGASLRRFDLKVRFDYLRPEQSWALFRELAEQRDLPAEGLSEEVAERLAALPNLTPGDFAALSRRLRFLPGGADARSLLQALDQESRLKRGGVARPIGFTAAV